MFQLSKVPLRFFLCLNIIMFHGLHNAKVVDAAIVYVSQQRHVEASANVDGKSFSDRIDAADFELFDKVLDRSFTYGEGFATGYASQTSSLGAEQITGSGRVSGTTGPPAGSSGGSGNTAMNVNFQIPNRAEYHLEFDVDVLELTSYSLVGPSINHVYNGPLGDTTSISETGELLPGDYSFQISIGQGAAASGIPGSFDLRFTVVPEPSCLALIGVCGIVPLMRRRVTVK